MGMPAVVALALDAEGIDLEGVSPSLGEGRSVEALVRSPGSQMGLVEEPVDDPKSRTVRPREWRPPAGSGVTSP